MPHGAPGKKRLLTTVLFTDIVGSTQRTQELGDRRWRQLLTTHHGIVRRALKRHGGREIDTAGDGFFATFDQPADAIECATDLIDRLREAGIDIRAGVHMGEVEVMGSKVGGIAVHIGARIMSKADAGHVMVSGTVRDLMAGSEFAFDDAGFHELKGVAAQVHLYAVRHPPTEREPEVAPQVPPDGAERRRRNGRLLAAAIVAVTAAVTVFVLTRSHPAPEAFAPAPNTVVELDPSTGEVTGGVHVGTTPTALAAGKTELWVANFDDKTIQRIDVSSLAVSPARGGLLSNPTGIAVGGGFVWVTNGFSGQVVKVDPRQANVTESVPVGSGVQGIAYGLDRVWIAQSNEGVLLRLDPVDGSVDRLPLPEGSQPVDVAVGGDSVWVADGQGGRVIEVDPEAMKVRQSIPLLGGQPTHVAFGDGFVWVTSYDSDSLTRIEPASGGTTTVPDVGNGPLGVAAGPGGVWVANGLDGTVARVDPTKAKVVGRTPLGFSPDAVAVTPEGVWVSLHSL